MLSKEDYAPYKDVLPSAKTLNNYKVLLAVQAEVDAANALFIMPSNVQCTLYYNTTSWCKIDRDWLIIIFIFSEKQRHVLVQLILHKKTILTLSVRYWRHTNGWPFLSMATIKNREWQQKNCGKKLQSS